ncbi:hypothetical protein [Desulfofustis glycolicus]|uniref:Beta-barrel porin 2 n=1 Tax=Desulfofustis glycolicus DSM 9705 TaxID=1121409 RepID=A0A1M5YL91_9BACT|nr:hypothetical protein [Desulfofustis glycolicus]SHI12825.1 hypothetical protein SAMN02745124_04188 [Desulfofustis glycolicus DSM 9705]
MVAQIQKTAVITALVSLPLVLAIPHLSQARSNILTGGVSISYDYEDRDESYFDDPDTEIDESRIEREEDDYKALALSPYFILTSTTPRDNLEFHVRPELRYDLYASESDFDGSFRVVADRYITRAWQVGVSNEILRSDYYRTSGDVLDPAAPPEAAATGDPTLPELSPDTRRTRYWRNTLELFSEHTYSQESLIRLGFNYIVLRNDDDDFSDVEDFDRYEFILADEHRFNPRWSTLLDLRYIIGDFQPAEIAAVAEDEPAPIETTSDLDEYRLFMELRNHSIPRNPLSASYSFIGTRYDETEIEEDIDIHQVRFTWRRDYSPGTYTSIGIGPAYVVSGDDESWEGTGLAEWNYALQRGNLNVAVEKGYDTEDFDGTSERGLVDYWESRFSFSYRLSQYLTMTGRLSYLYEDREDVITVPLESPDETIEAIDSFELDTYHNDRYEANIGLGYTFMQYYTASVDYTFTKQESDRIDEEYDDHRILLTLSWESELLRW